MNRSYLKNLYLQEIDQSGMDAFRESVRHLSSTTLIDKILDKLCSINDTEGTNSMLALCILHMETSPVFCTKLARSKIFELVYYVALDHKGFIKLRYILGKLMPFYEKTNGAMNGRSCVDGTGEIALKRTIECSEYLKSHNDVENFDNCRHSIDPQLPFKKQQLLHKLSNSSTFLYNYILCKLVTEDYEFDYEPKIISGEERKAYLELLTKICLNNRKDQKLIRYVKANNYMTQLCILDGSHFADCEIEGVAMWQVANANYKVTARYWLCYLSAQESLCQACGNFVLDEVHNGIKKNDGRYAENTVEIQEQINCYYELSVKSKSVDDLNFILLHSCYYRTSVVFRILVKSILSFPLNKKTLDSLKCFMLNTEMEDYLIGVLKNDPPFIKAIQLIPYLRMTDKLSFAFTVLIIGSYKDENVFVQNVVRNITYRYRDKLLMRKDWVIEYYVTTLHNLLPDINCSFTFLTEVFGETMSLQRNMFDIFPLLYTKFRLPDEFIRENVHFLVSKLFISNNIAKIRSLGYTKKEFRLFGVKVLIHLFCNNYYDFNTLDQFFAPSTKAFLREKLSHALFYLKSCFNLNRFCVFKSLKCIINVIDVNVCFNYVFPFVEYFIVNKCSTDCANVFLEFLIRLLDEQHRWRLVPYLKSVNFDDVDLLMECKGYFSRDVIDEKVCEVFRMKLLNSCCSDINSCERKIAKGDLQACVSDLSTVKKMGDGNTESNIANISEDCFPLKITNVKTREPSLEHGNDKHEALSKCEMGKVENVQNRHHDCINRWMGKCVHACLAPNLSPYVDKCHSCISNDSVFMALLLYNFDKNISFRSKIINLYPKFKNSTLMSYLGAIRLSYFLSKLQITKNNQVHSLPVAFLNHLLYDQDVVKQDIHFYVIQEILKHIKGSLDCRTENLVEQFRHTHYKYIHQPKFTNKIKISNYSEFLRTMFEFGLEMIRHTEYYEMLKYGNLFNDALLEFTCIAIIKIVLMKNKTAASFGKVTDGTENYNAVKNACEDEGSWIDAGRKTTCDGASGIACSRTNHNKNQFLYTEVVLDPSIPSESILSLFKRIILRSNHLADKKILSFILSFHLKTDTLPLSFSQDPGSDSLDTFHTDPKCLLSDAYLLKASLDLREFHHSIMLLEKMIRNGYKLFDLLQYCYYSIGDLEKTRAINNLSCRISPYNLFYELCMCNNHEFAKVCLEHAKSLTECYKANNTTDMGFGDYDILQPDDSLVALLSSTVPFYLSGLLKNKDDRDNTFLEECKRIESKFSVWRTLESRNVLCKHFVKDCELLSSGNPYAFRIINERRKIAGNPKLLLDLHQLLLNSIKNLLETTSINTDVVKAHNCESKEAAVMAMRLSNKDLLKEDTVNGSSTASYVENNCSITSQFEIDLNRSFIDYYTRSEEFTNALNEINKQLLNKKWIFLYDLAKLRLKEGKPNLAKDALKKLIKLFPKGDSCYVKALIKYAEILNLADVYNDAIKQIEDMNVAQVCKESIERLNGLGWDENTFVDQNFLQRLATKESNLFRDDMKDGVDNTGMYSNVREANEKILAESCGNKQCLFNHPLRDPNYKVRMDKSISELDFTNRISLQTLYNFRDLYKNSVRQLENVGKLYLLSAKKNEKLKPEVAIKYYISCLKCTTTYSYETVPNIFHLLCELTNFKVIKNIKLESLNPKIFLPFFGQIIPKLGVANTEISSIVTEIIISIMNKYPYETYWNFLLLLNSKNKTVKKEAENIKSELTFDNRVVLNNIVKVSEHLMQIAKKTTKLTQLSISDNFPKIMALFPINANIPNTHILINSINDEIQVFQSLQAPKRISFIGEDGKSYLWLCKHKDDLRKDNRFMNISNIVNNLCRKQKLDLYIRTYKVIPVTHESGIIEWVGGLNSLKTICTSYYSKLDISVSEVARKFAGVKKIGPNSFLKIVNKFPPQFHNWFLDNFPKPRNWFTARNNYTRTYAVMNVMGWFMGLGDRHTENILFDINNGDTVHVDLNCIFNSNKSLSIPEKVPYRLTQNIVDAFGVTGVEGTYKFSMNECMKLFIENRDLLVSNLLSFIHDPLFEWNKSKTSLKIAEDLKTKLENIDGPTKVDALDEEAMCTTNLSNMYIGWLPYI